MNRRNLSFPIFMSIKEFLSIYLQPPHLSTFSNNYVISTPKERKKFFKKKEGKQKKKRELYGSSIYILPFVWSTNPSNPFLDLVGMWVRSGFWLVLVSIPCFLEREAPVVYKLGSEGSLDFQWTGLVGTFHNP